MLEWTRIMWIHFHTTRWNNLMDLQKFYQKCIPFVFFLQPVLKIFCLVVLYSTLWTLMLLSFSKHVFLRQNDRCLQANDDHICRDARVSGSPLDVSHSTTSVKPTSKPIPQRWIPRGGYVTYNNKKVSFKIPHQIMTHPLVDDVTC